MNAIVVAGEALVDLVLREDGSFAAYPGGGPYNVARTLGRLGAHAAFLGRLSDDAFGARLRAELEADGVDLAAAVATHAPTTLALAETDAGGSATYRFYAQGTSAPGLEEADVAAVGAPEVLYVGTLGLVFEPIASTLETLVARMPPTTLVAVDPNCRPDAIADEDAYRTRLQRILARADIIKVSEDDLAWLSPATPAVTAARQLLLRDGAVALITLGARGALVVDADSETAVSAPPVDVVDTIGAGDAFMGAFLAARHDHDTIAAARFACEVAALTCARAGADPPRRGEI
jgi:fructokinase